MPRKPDRPTVTTDHAASSYGVPVILDARGRVMDYADGLRAVMGALGWDKHGVAGATGRSVRTVEGWLQGRPPDAAALNALSAALSRT